MRASLAGSSAILASSWRPGTDLVIGVRLGGFGEMTLRSVCGVKAKGGSPGSELFAGVVAGLLVVRSALSKQMASATLPWSCISRRSQRVAAAADALAASTRQRT